MTIEVRTSPKKARMPQRRSLALREAIAGIAAEYDRPSVRQLFYQLVSRDAVEKTERSTSGPRCRGADAPRWFARLRKVTDGHRSRRIVYAHSSLHEALQQRARPLPPELLARSTAALEVWSEKDALSGVITPVCDRYGVPYVATRGFPSVTLLYGLRAGDGGDREAGNDFLLWRSTPPGRASATGWNRPSAGFGADAMVRRVALNPDQIHAYSLPTDPASRPTADRRDLRRALAVPPSSWTPSPDLLTRLVERGIVSAIDREAWRRVSRIEALEADTLESIALAGWVPGTLYSASEDAA